MSLQYGSSLGSIALPIKTKHKGLSTGATGSLAVVGVLSLCTTLTMTAAAFSLQKAMRSMALFPFVVILLIVICFFLPLFGMVLMTSCFYDKNTLLALKLPTKYKTMQTMVLMGTCTAFSGVSIVFSNVHVAPLLQSLLGPTILTIPFTLVISLFFGARYNLLQVIAAVKFISLFFLSFF